MTDFFLRNKKTGAIVNQSGYRTKEEAESIYIGEARAEYDVWCSDFDRLRMSEKRWHKTLRRVGKN